jgi:hypothetical protein
MLSVYVHTPLLAKTLDLLKVLNCAHPDAEKKEMSHQEDVSVLIALGNRGGSTGR